jgi:hypothetical protein
VPNANFLQLNENQAGADHNQPEAGMATVGIDDGGFNTSGLMQSTSTSAPKKLSPITSVLSGD